MVSAATIKHFCGDISNYWMRVGGRNRESDVLHDFQIVQIIAKVDDSCGSLSALTIPRTQIVPQEAPFILDTLMTSNAHLFAASLHNSVGFGR
jgi:hypothetical protein